MGTFVHWCFHTQTYIEVNIIAFDSIVNGKKKLDKHRKRYMIESKFEEIKHTVMSSDNQSDVLSLCDTLWTKHTTDNELQVPGYVFERKDRKPQVGGSLLVYFSEAIKCLRKKHDRNQGYWNNVG